MHYEIIRTELIHGEEVPSSVVNVKRDNCRKRDFPAMCADFSAHPELFIIHDERLWQKGHTFRYEFLCRTYFGGVYVGFTHDVGVNANPPYVISE